MLHNNSNHSILLLFLKTVQKLFQLNQFKSC